MTTPERTIQPGFEELDQLLQTAFPPGSPGAAVIAARDGAVLLRGGYGMANLEWQIPAAPDTVFRIGSVTKQFTSVAILMLAERGKLDLLDPLEKFLPGYPTHGHTITIEHLLTHTSGIKSYTSMQEWMPAWGREFALEALIDFFKFQPMDFAPGQKWRYNNSAYVLLGAIIEKVAGLSYGEFLEQEIFAPLGLRSTCLELPGRVIPRRAAGYSKDAQGFMNAPYISMTQPLGAGGLVSTVDDLAAWDAALNAGQLISAASLRRARTSAVLPDGCDTHYGCGWGLHAYAERPVADHGGGIHGFVCHALSFPAEKVYAALLTNCGAPAVSPDVVTFRAALQALGLPYQAPQAVELPEADLGRFVGKFQDEDGDQFELTLEDGCLWLAWPGLPEKRQMVPTAPDTLIDIQNPLVRNLFLDGEDGSFTRIESRNQYDEPGLKAVRVAEEEGKAEG